MVQLTHGTFGMDVVDDVVGEAVVVVEQLISEEKE